jgi:hypothetical protein
MNFIIVTYSGFSIHNGSLLHSKSQYTTVKHSRKLLEHTYTSDPHGTGTLTPIEFFQQGFLWQSSNTHFHSCSQKASKHTSGQSIVGLSVHLHTTTAPRRIVQAHNTKYYMVICLTLTFIVKLNQLKLNKSKFMLFRVATSISPWSLIVWPKSYNLL